MRRAAVQTVIGIALLLCCRDVRTEQTTVLKDVRSSAQDELPDDLRSPVTSVFDGAGRNPGLCFFHTQRREPSHGNFPSDGRGMVFTWAGGIAYRTL
jgi:hypothetical protein